MISVRVPASALPRWRWLWLRARHSVRKQFRRRTWAVRANRLAVWLDGGPTTYVRIEAPGVRLLVAQDRFGATLHNIRVTASGGGAFTGGLTREKLTADDRTGACVLLTDPAAPAEWAFSSLVLGTVN